MASKAPWRTRPTLIALLLLVMLPFTTNACSFLLTSVRVPTSTFSLINFHLRFRGPDLTTRWRHAPDGLEFVHNLLHMRGERTPQPLRSGDGSVAVLFNGEIYNSDAFRAPGAAPRDNDGPSILEAYRRHGAAFAQQLDGEFAIALVDWEKDLLVVATDAFGTKPLWLALGGQGSKGAAGTGSGGRQWGVATYASALQRLGLAGAVQAEPNTIVIRRLSTLAPLAKHRTRSFDLLQHKDHIEDWTAAFERAVLKRVRGSAVRHARAPGAVKSGGEEAAHVPFIGLSSGYDSGALGCALSVLAVPHRAYSILGNEHQGVLKQRVAFASERGALLSHELLELNRSSFGAAQRELYRRAEEFTYEEGHADSTVDMREDGGAVGLSSVCARARRDGALVYLSGTGADEIISDYGAFGQKLTRHSQFGGAFPTNLSSIFPWRSFFKGTQRSYLMKEEMVSGAHGLEGRYPFLDVALVQEYLWLTPRIKNLLYKAPLHAYLARHGCAFDFNIKMGFASIRKDASVAEVDAMREQMNAAPDPAKHLERCGEHDTSCGQETRTAAAMTTETETQTETEAEMAAANEEAAAAGEVAGSLERLLRDALSGGVRQLVLGSTTATPAMPAAVAEFLGAANWSDVTSVHSDPTLRPDVLWTTGSRVIQLAEGSFDEVHAFVVGGGGASMEWGGTDPVAALLSEAHRLLRSGGHLCASLPRQAALPPVARSGSRGSQAWFGLPLRDLAWRAHAAGFALAMARRAEDALHACFTKASTPLGALAFDATAAEVAAEGTVGLLAGEGAFQLAVASPSSEWAGKLAVGWRSFATAAMRPGASCTLYAQWHEALIEPLDDVRDAEHLVLLALELLPGCAVPMLTLGRVQADQERLAEALATFETTQRGALAGDGGGDASATVLDALVNMGTIHTRMGALAAAVRCFSAAMHLAPRHEKAFTNFHKLFVGRGVHTTKGHLLDATLSEQRATLRALMAAAEAAARSSAAAAASREAEAAAGATAIGDSALFALGVALHQLGQPAASEAVYRRFIRVRQPPRPRLAVPAHDASRGLRVVTMATEHVPALADYLQSARDAGLAQGAVSVVGMGAAFVANAMKLDMFAEALATMAPAQLVLVTDAYDVLLMPATAGGAGLERRFAAFGTPLVASAEMGCWPDAGAAGLYPAPPLGHANSPFRFLNSGAIIGAAGPFLAMLRTMQSYGSCFVSDQRCFARYFLENPGVVALDHGAELFFNLFGVRNSTFSVEPSGQMTSSLSGTSPCLIHGNGGDKRLFEGLKGVWRRAKKEGRTIRVRV